MDAVSRIDGEIEAVETDELADELADATIPADPDVKNYSYTLVEDKVYYRENSIMKPVDMSESMQERIKGMVGIRNCTQELINLQLEEYPDTVIKEKQKELNTLYDTFSRKYGLINSQTNKRAFNQDSSYCLLCSLEKLDDEGNFKGKADMFTKRTIKKAEVVTSVDTATEALAVSLSEKAKVDLSYMAELTGKEIDTIKEELTGIIFQNPVTDRWEDAPDNMCAQILQLVSIGSPCDAASDNIIKCHYGFSTEPIFIKIDDMHFADFLFHLPVFMNGKPSADYPYMLIAVDSSGQLTNPFTKSLVTEFVLWTCGCRNLNKNNILAGFAILFLHACCGHLRYRFKASSVFEIVHHLSVGNFLFTDVADALREILAEPCLRFF